MEKLNIVARVLDISKGKIKDMCKSGEIIFEIVNGIYYVDLDEVKEKISKDRRFYKSIISSDMYYISRLSDEFKINGNWLKEMVTDIAGYWNDVGVHHKSLEYFGTWTPIKYGLFPISFFENKSDYENLFGGILDKNSMFIWIKHYNDFSMNSLNVFNYTYQSHSYKKEFKIGILNPSTKQIKVFDIDTKIFNTGSDLEWFEIIKNHSINEKMIDYNTTKTLNLGILSKPIGTAHLIVTNNENVISWGNINNESYQSDTESQPKYKTFWIDERYISSTK